MSPSRPPRRSPQAFNLEPEKKSASQEKRAQFTLTAEPDAFAGDADPRAPVSQAPGASFGWAKLLFGALGLLATLALGLAVTNLVDALFAAQGWLGWLALALSAVAAMAMLAVVAREIAGVARLRRITALRVAAGAAHSGAQASAVIADLSSLYAHRPDCAAALLEIRKLAGEVIDPVDRLRIVEKTLLAPLDRDARRLVAAAVKRVSLVTAISPAALVDVGFAGLTHVGLIRAISRLYGGRPGFLGVMRLTRIVVAHLAVTGSLALGDQLVGQIIGHGLAARLSARLGEGVLNGLLAARVGKAAIEMCRPMSFSAAPAPSVTQLAAGILPNKTSKKP
ncbi:MAG: YcjF family protein [Alphaproteobacteria bacterium]